MMTLKKPMKPEALEVIEPLPAIPILKLIHQIIKRQSHPGQRKKNL